VRKDMHFVLYRYCCEGRYCVNIHLKCLEKSVREKSGDLIMTGEWQAGMLTVSGSCSSCMDVVVRVSL